MQKGFKKGLRLGSRKAALEMQFNWIFVLIAGAVVFAFIIAIILGISRAKRNSGDADLVENLDTILKTAQQSSMNSKEAFRNITSSGFTLQLVCDGEDYSIMQSGSAQKNIQSLIIFSRGNLGGKRIYAWNRNFELPFLVGTFLYLSDDNTQYVFVDSDANTKVALQEMYAEVPLDRNKRLMNRGGLASFEDTGYEHYTFIFQNEMPNVDAELSRIPKKKISVVDFMPANDADYGALGGLTFYSGKTDSTKNSNYVQIESLYGAIFSEDQEFYDCTMKKALKRLRFQLDVTKRRSADLSAYYVAAGNVCAAYYTGVDAPIATMMGISEVVDATNAQRLFQNARELYNQNQDTLLASCPSIY
jgi:hypothetical protein